MGTRSRSAPLSAERRLRFDGTSTASTNRTRGRATPGKRRYTSPPRSGLVQPAVGPVNSSGPPVAPSGGPYPTRATGALLNRRATGGPVPTFGGARNCRSTAARSAYDLRRKGFSGWNASEVQPQFFERRFEPVVVPTFSYRVVPTFRAATSFARRFSHRARAAWKLRGANDVVRTTHRVRVETPPRG